MRARLHCSNIIFDTKEYMCSDATDGGFQTNQTNQTTIIKCDDAQTGTRERDGDGRDVVGINEKRVRVN